VLLRKLVASIMLRMPNTQLSNWISQPTWPPPAMPAGFAETVTTALVLSWILPQAPAILPPTKQPLQLGSAGTTAGGR